MEELRELFEPNRAVPLTDSDKAYAMLRYIQNQVALFRRPELNATAPTQLAPP